MVKVLTIIFVLILLASSASAQLSLPCKSNSDVLLAKDRGSTYITFERVGFRKPRNKSESGAVVWLKLHNNSVWAIYIDTYSLHTESDYIQIQTCKGKVESLRPGVDVEPFYVAERNSTGEIIFSLGEPNFTITANTWLASGQTLLFAIPQEHLAYRLRISIPFSYEWQWKWKGEKPDSEIDYKSIRQSVSFYAYDIPEETEKQK